MCNEVKKFRGQEEQASSNAARKALDGGDASKALSLIQNVSLFWSQNLIVLLSVISFHSEDEPLVRRAYSMFNRQLGLCSSPQSLTQVAMWVRNPVRAKSIPVQLKNAVDGHRKKLEPDWDGIWHDPGTGSSNKAPIIVKEGPEKVFDPHECLIAASQTSNWGPWISRYVLLGGSTESLTYLKLMVAKAVPLRERPSLRTKGLLKKFTMLATVPQVRSFLRGITPTKAGIEGKTPNAELARYALYLYCGYERIDHTVEDWVHIAKSALYLDHHVVARITQRILAEMKRNSEAEEVFQRLLHKNGEIDITQSARNDIGFRGNTIWESLYHRIPINADARKILTSYSQGEIDSV